MLLPVRHLGAPLIMCGGFSSRRGVMWGGFETRPHMKTSEPLFFVRPSLTHQYQI